MTDLARIIQGMRSPYKTKILNVVTDNPGANVTEITRIVGCHPSTVSSTLKFLKNKDFPFVREEKIGRYVHYYPVESIREKMIKIQALMIGVLQEADL